MRNVVALFSAVVCAAAIGCSVPLGEEELLEDEEQGLKEEDDPSAFAVFTSEGIGGFGPIRDLKFAKGSSSSQRPLDGYHLIPADLNKGAGGQYIYITFTREQSAVTNGSQCGYMTNNFLTGIHASNFNAIDAIGKKGNCSNPGYPWEPIWEPREIPIPTGWKHPDLNDGSGGRFIFAWQHKVSGLAPITEIGVTSARRNANCPSGWTKVNQDLNQGAGGDYIYFCYRT